jgi:glycosyltransferase involved in cell wall biosynthesis
MPDHLVTVVLPVYNAVDYLADAIESILNQTLKDIELLIVNDGSTDSSMEIVHKYASLDPRISIVENPVNMGLIKTLNVALKHAKGKYIARQDSDDISLPHRLQTQLDFLEDNPDCVMAGSAIVQIDKTGKIFARRKVLTSDGAIRSMMLLYSGLLGPTIMMRNEVIQSNHLEYDLDMLHAEDYDFYCRLSRLGRVANIPEPLYKYRLHGESVSDKNLDLQEETASRISYREIGNAGLTDEFNFDDVLLIRNYSVNSASLSVTERIKQIKTVCNLVRNCASTFPINLEEKAFLKKTWLRKCCRPMQHSKSLQSYFWRLVYSLAGEI